MRGFRFPTRMEFVDWGGRLCHDFQDLAAQGTFSGQVVKTKSAALTAICVLAWGAVILGHHSLADAYRVDQHRTIQGTLTELNIRNPHSLMTVSAPDGDGRTVGWEIEWLGVSDLTKAGIHRLTLRTGDQVTVTGAPVKGEDRQQRKLLMQRIVRATDQWKWESPIGFGYPSTTPLPRLPNP